MYMMCMCGTTNSVHQRINGLFLREHILLASGRKGVKNKTKR